MTSRLTLLAAAALALAVSAGSALAQARVAVGVLDCRSGSSTSFIVGSVRYFDCTFRPGHGGRQFYQGVAQRVGLDVGFTGAARLVWTVFAPTRTVGPGQLAGNYVGVSAGAAIGPGIGANALVGGFNNSFALQPLSVEAQQGLNVALGMAGFELRYGH